VIYVLMVVLGVPVILVTIYGVICLFRRKDG
jgi:hypothetical protein